MNLVYTQMNSYEGYTSVSVERAGGLKQPDPLEKPRP